MTGKDLEDLSFKDLLLLESLLKQVSIIVKNKSFSPSLCSLYNSSQLLESLPLPNLSIHLEINGFAQLLLRVLFRFWVDSLALPGSTWEKSTRIFMMIYKA